jgi:hypothetical protein
MSLATRPRVIAMFDVERSTVLLDAKNSNKT